MARKNKIASIEPWIFIAFLIANSVPLLFFRWFPSLDGPVNLSASRIITSFLAGDPLTRSFFDFHWLSPNLTSFVLQGLLGLAFPSWVTDKIMLFLLVTLFPLAVRYLVRSKGNSTGLLHLIVFPFAWNFTLMMGDYDFILGIILVLFALGWFLRQDEDMNFSQGLFFAFLNVLMVFTNWLSFPVFLVAFLFVTYSIFRVKMHSGTRSKHLRGLYYKIFYFTIIFLPAIVFYILVMTAWGDKTIHTGFLGFWDHLRWLAVTRPLVVYVWDQEWLLGLAATFAFLIPIFWLLIAKFNENKDGKNWTFEKGFLLLSLCFLILFFLVPDSVRGVTRQMGVQILLPMYIFLITWLASVKIPAYIQLGSVGIILIPYALLAVFHIRQVQPLNQDVKSIERLSWQIPDGTVLYPVNCSDNWIQAGFLDYLAADKKLIVLDHAFSNPCNVISWKPEVQNIMLNHTGKITIDSSFFQDKALLSKVDCIIFRDAEDVPAKFQVFGKALLNYYSPIDSSGSDYPAIYIRKDQFPLKNWKHETEQALKRYFNITSSSVIDTEYLNILRIPGPELPKGELMWMEVHANLEPVSFANEDSIYLVLMTEHDGVKMDYRTVVTPVDSISLQKELCLKYRFPEPLTKNDVVKLYFWNPDHVVATIKKSMIRVNYFR